MPIIDGYLENPTIKLSPPILLNDPFETQNTQTVSDYIYNTYKDEYQLPETEESDFKDQRRKVILTRAPMKIIRSSGIFSLSESNRSLLMWAHYADQHKGMVIGFDDDFLYKEAETNESIPPRLIYSPKPIKVNYDTVRFDVSEFHTAESHIIHVSRLLALKMLTTKSDDWLYEKEYRSILPIAMADEIRFRGVVSDLSKMLERHRKANDFFIDFRRKNKPVSINKDIAMTNILYQRMSASEHFIFLKKVNPKKINSIYFGVRAKEADILSVIRTINKNKDKLGHIRLYKYELCDRQFTLLKEEINGSERLKIFDFFKSII